MTVKVQKNFRFKLLSDILDEPCFIEVIAIIEHAI